MPKQQITIVIIGDSGRSSRLQNEAKRTWAWLWTGGKVLSGVIGVAAAIVTVWAFLR